MAHDISCLPSHQNRAAWERAAQPLLTRMLCKASTVDQITPEAIWRAMEEGSLRITPEDIENGEQSALLALLGRFIQSSDDVGTMPVSEASQPVLGQADQSIARRLIQAGCAIDKPLVSLPGQADAMDLCLALNADQVLSENLDRISWSSRTMVGLPWLHYAARRGMVATMQVLLDKGAPVDGVDNQGNSALFHASDRSCVQLLIDRGANASLFNDRGETPVVHWEASRKVKGERLSQLRAALPRQQNLTPAQEFEQLLKTLPRTTKSRLEKEVKRLRLAGGERHEGAGVLIGILDRCRQTLAEPMRGSSDQQCASLLDFASSWKGLVEHATTAELCDLQVASAAWGVATPQSVLAALALKLPDLDARARALSMSAKRWLELKNGSSARRFSLVKWVLKQENLDLFGPLMLSGMRLLHEKDDAYEPLIAECENRWMDNPSAQIWKASTTVDALLEMATVRIYQGVKKREQFHAAAVRMADQALLLGALPSAAAVRSADQSTSLVPIQREWLDGFMAKVQSARLDRQTTVAPLRRSGPRL